MRELLCSIAVLATVLASAEDEFRQVPTAQKSTGDDLAFLLTFDGYNAKADVAKGGGDSFATRDLDLGLKGVIGFDRQNAYCAAPGEILRFPAKGNFNPHDGTLVCWANARGYDPSDSSEEAKKRGNVILVNFEARNGERGFMMHLYAFADVLYFDWTTCPKPYVFGEYARASGKLSRIRQGEWHQLTATWNDRKIVLYIDGEKCEERQLPLAKVEEFQSLMPDDQKNSYVGVRAGGWDDRNEADVAVDDVAIYSRAMSDIEVKNQYLALLKNLGSRRPTAFGMRLNGTVSGRGGKSDVDRIEAEFDLSGLPSEAKRKLSDGGVEATYVLRGPDGYEKRGTTTFHRLKECRLFDGVVKSGLWTLEVEIAGAKESCSIERPDMPWIGNGIGEEDVVPAIWRDFAVKDRLVTLWNRRYAFDAGPLPTNITVYGGALLAARPKLVVNGREPEWQAGETERKNRFVVFTGKGRAGDVSIDYRTTVEFDGMIKFDWTVEGNPAIDDMHLEWQVRPENARWLMMPELCEVKEDPVQFSYPQKMIWLVSERAGGFAYAQPNDANWVYEKDEKVFSADRKTGRCRVGIITKRVERMPDSTPYTALFIATPTRPLPSRNRALRWGSGMEGGIKLVHASGEGFFNSSFTHAPQDCPAFQRRYGRNPKDSLSVYGAVKSLTVAEPEARYLDKYWERPGAYQYVMELTKQGPDGKIVRTSNAGRSACVSTVYSDYLVWCDWKLWTHPLGDRFWQSYFDLCGVNFCRSELHGCLETDKFGRKVPTYDVLHLRRLLMRLVALAHRFGKTVILHGQRNYLPFAQGLADYWFPGEQNAAMLLRNINGYTDDVPDSICRTELNRDVLGVGVLHLPALGQACRQKRIEWDKEENWRYTWAMLAKLQVHDIETCELWAAEKPVRRLWDVLERHRLDDPATRCHLYFEQQTVTSSDEKVRITWYDCLRGEKLLVLANLTPEDRPTTVNLSKFAGWQVGKEELHGGSVTTTGDGFQVTVPARNLYMIPIRRRK